MQIWIRSSINSFHPLKMPENQKFSDVFKVIELGFWYVLGLTLSDNLF